MSKEKKDGNWFKRHKILTGIGVIIIIAIIAGAVGGDKKDGTTTTANSNNTSSSSSSKSETTVAKLNEPARDGKFEFTVTSIKCAVPSVSDDSGYLSKSAQGQYCEMGVTVKNIGDEAQMFDGSNQYLYNASNQKYTYDSTATLYANPSNSTFLNNINPGNTASGTVVFDLPQGVTPTTAELHDSSLSGGIKVNLQ